MPATDSDEEYEVEQIVDSRVRRGKRYFRIRWKGFGADDDTWEPVENLGHCLQLVKTFEKTHPRASTPMKSKNYIIVGEVESIMDSMVQNGKKLFYVRWRGFPAKEDTWEPLENLSHCLELVKNFEAADSRASTPAKIRTRQEEKVEEVARTFRSSSNSSVTRSQNMIFSPHGFKEVYGRYPLIDEVKENARMRSLAKLKGERTPELKVDSSTVKHKTPESRNPSWFFALYIGVAVCTIAVIFYVSEQLQLFSFPAT